MAVIVTLLVVFAIGFFILFLFAVLNVSSDSDDKANYSEEYGMDFDDEDY